LDILDTFRYLEYLGCVPKLTASAENL